MDEQWTAPGPGPWQQDSAHSPAAQTAVMQELYPEGFNRGFSETMSRYGSLLDTLAMGVVNGFTYHQPRPFDVPGPDGPLTEEQLGAEIMRRAQVAADAFERRIWRDDLELWDEELKPATIERHRALAGVDLVSLDDDGLRAHLCRCSDEVRATVYQHHRFNLSALVPVGDFLLTAARWLEVPPTTLLHVFDGYSPVSGVVPPDMADAVAALRADAEARALLDGPEAPDARLAELRRRRPEVDEYVRTVGSRLVEGFDVTNPTLVESPALVLGKLAGALQADPDAARQRADALAGQLRSRLPEERRAAFDELLADARLVYRLRDERGLYSDVSSVGLLRLALLEVGRRLADRGRLRDADDALDLTMGEALALLSGATAPGADEARERGETRRRRTLAGAPRHLGPPPPPPPPLEQLPPSLARLMSAVGFLIEGVLGQREEAGGDHTVVLGIPGSTGVVEGPARLVRDSSELDRLEPGDVLVAPTTGEAFNSTIHLVAAIVTDHGSFASHAAIVAREMGFPAVVGTTDGTRRIPDGAMVRVDGTAGQVSILP